VNVAQHVLDLPEVYRVLVPVLTEIRFDEEHLANCLACPMAPKPGQDLERRSVFTAPARCCTYTPLLPNYAVGRILRRDDRGSRRMLARLADAGGVTPLGVGPDEARSREYHDKALNGGFGRLPELNCPYWEGGLLPCAIYRDRNSVCRTWHCKHVGGARGHAVWMAYKELLFWFEQRLSRLCVERGKWPGEGSTLDDRTAWFLACATTIDTLPEADLAALRAEDGLRVRAIALRTRAAERDHALPDVLQPTVQDWEFGDAVVLMTAYSAYDMRELPRWVFVLLSRMDGRTPWRDALAGAEAELGVAIGEGLVHDLYRLGLVSVGGAREWKPGAEMAMHRLLVPDPV
jgi:hypothetical protein